MRINARIVSEAARGRWRDLIYPALGIEVGTGKHRACPNCGGKDRFRCDDKDGNGSHFCNQCGAGDGFRLVGKARRCSFPEAVRMVAGTLGIDAHTPIDRVALERERRWRERERLKKERDKEATELTVDALREAERFIRSRSGLNISSWSDQRLDDELNALATAHAILDAERLYD